MTGLVLDLQATCSHYFVVNKPQSSEADGTAISMKDARMLLRSRGHFMCDSLGNEHIVQHTRLPSTQSASMPPWPSSSSKSTAFLSGMTRDGEGVHASRATPAYIYASLPTPDLARPLARLLAPNPRNATRWIGNGQKKGQPLYIPCISVSSK